MRTVNYHGYWALEFYGYTQCIKFHWMRYKIMLLSNQSFELWIEVILDREWVARGNIDQSPTHISGNLSTWSNIHLTSFTEKFKPSYGSKCCGDLRMGLTFVQVSPTSNRCGLPTRPLYPSCMDSMIIEECMKDMEPCLVPVSFFTHTWPHTTIVWLCLLCWYTKCDAC